MSDTQSLQQQLEREINFRMSHEPFPRPIRIDPYYYYTTIGQRGQLMHMRKPVDTPFAEGQVVLDTAQFTDLTKSNCLPGRLLICENHRRFGVMAEHPQLETCDLYIFDLEPPSPAAPTNTTTKSTLEGFFGVANEEKLHLVAKVPNIVNAEFNADATAVLYTQHDERFRPYVLRQRNLPALDAPAHSIVGRVVEDALLLTENDDRNFVDIGKTKDNKFFTINVNNKRASKVSLLPTRSGASFDELAEVTPPGPCHYFVEHAHGQLYIITDWQAPNYCVMTTQGPAEPWLPFVEHNPRIKIDDAEIFSSCLVLYESTEASPQISIVSLQDGSRRTKTLPEPFHLGNLEPTINAVFASKNLNFNTSDPLHQRIDWQLNLATCELNQLEQHDTQDVAGFVASQYEVTRLWAPTSDNLSVPITIVGRRDQPLSQPAPTLALVYGAYGHNLERRYNPTWVSLLQRGFRLAYCHVRGGGELGTAWHEGGMGLHKRNTFLDLEACLSYLVNEGITTTEQLALRGASAGGLAAAHIVVRRPDMIRACVLSVPFVDVLTTMLDSTLPLTRHEYDEWGNPELDREAFANIRGYCPYHNIADGHFPSCYIVGCLHDSRVKYWQPAKFAAKVRCFVHVPVI
ncbi:uncharacterized protein MONBRDRAFT_25261 [Monosiga brevicollis MX1]|uniref:Prolyl endopeptidase n=1 Tax=Monosiga brevicollis TaxID=81824 RepID=A9UYW1_MONBE|nr:uncharacterized protein MONBRDRAFT_25261 [Monosiga brevicollis MX1]EDQ89530.1 predicted protein [Monosiga brevicollis MX1]|eukprot:XP_001745559.1 hypothetical protein [Monosiga brevicollis MX1]